MHIIYVDDLLIDQVKFEIEAEKTGKVSLLKAFDGAEEALQYCKKKKPDFAFLDIEMPGKNGIWLGKKLSDLGIPIAYISSHNDYATEAFSNSAIHYMLKPVTAEQISKVLSRFLSMKTGSEEQMKEHLRSAIKESISHVYPKRIFLNHVHKAVAINLTEVLYFSACRSYTVIKCTEGRKFTSSKTLLTYADMLEGHPDFVRIHRAHFVNKSYVQAILREKHKIHAQMADGSELEVSPAKREDIYELLR